MVLGFRLNFSIKMRYRISQIVHHVIITIIITSLINVCTVWSIQPLINVSQQVFAECGLIQKGTGAGITRLIFSAYMASSKKTDAT